MSATPSDFPGTHGDGRPRTVLVVDDDRVGRESLAEAVEELDFKVFQAPDGPTALAIVESEPIDLVLTDLKMPGMDGIELLTRIRRIDSTIHVILITAHATVQTAVEAMRRGAFTYIMKPIDLDHLAAQVEAAARARGLLLENIALREHLQRLGHVPELIGHSAAMGAVYELIAQVADTESVVLIRGESGTGKELVANAIHRNSARASGPFVKVNCAALSEALLESELFGHEEGAYTGAVRQRLGRFELADGGTLFLDEVSELAPTTQAKLLRVLQSYEFERLGGAETIKVDVRVLAATNADLEERVKQGRFREDLYYRLNVVPLFLPPLRDRREDIPLLVHSFVRRFAVRNRKDVTDITPDALGRLCRFPWPGNVRQLENCIERMVVTARTQVLDVDDLPPEILPPPEPSAGSASGFAVGMTMVQLEERAIRATLRATGGNRKEAARILGIGLRTRHPPPPPHPQGHELSGESADGDANGGEVDGELFVAVDAEDGVDLHVEECADGAASEAHGGGGEMEVLADMAGVHVDIAVGAFVVAALRACGDGGPGEDDGGLLAHLLAEAGIGDGAAEVAGAAASEGRVADVVVVEPGLDALDAVDHEIGLDGIAGAGGGRRAEGAAAAAGRNALGGPQELAELGLGEGGIEEVAHRPPLLDGRPEPLACDRCRRRQSHDALGGRGIAGCAGAALAAVVAGGALVALADGQMLGRVGGHGRPPSTDSIALLTPV